MRRKSLSDGVFDMGPAAPFRYRRLSSMPFLGSSSLLAPETKSRYLAFDALVSAQAVRHKLVTRRDKAMRLAVYGAVLVIALGSVLLGLDWLSAPMPPMTDTEAGLHAPPAVRPPPAPVVATPAAPNAPIGAADCPTGPGCACGPQRARPNSSASCTHTAGRGVGAAGAMSRGGLHGRIPFLPRVRFTYMPNAGQRRLCAK